MIKVRGNSGCKVELINDSTVRKFTDAAGIERLERQIKKQVDFCERKDVARIKAPKVLHAVKTSTELAVDMEFISGRDFIQFLTEAGRDVLDDFSTTMVAHIFENLTHCQTLDVTEKIQRKLDELLKNGVPRQYVEAARAKIEATIEIPVGLCHGDLTLSNILFKDQSFYFIDFLDSYVETPLQDIVKLKQDTRFGWSLQLYEAEFDRTKMQIALGYLDRKIEASFTSFKWYQNHCEIFELINWMRIFPYCKERKIAQFVTTTLDYLLIEQQGNKP